MRSRYSAFVLARGLITCSRHSMLHAPGCSGLAPGAKWLGWMRSHCLLDADHTPKSSSSPAAKGCATRLYERSRFVRASALVYVDGDQF
jgi:uncharacterized protein YchJ